MTIGKKLFLCIGAILTATLILGVMASVGLSRMGAGLDRVVDLNAKRQLLGSSIDINITKMISLIRGQDLRAMMKDQATAEKYHQDYKDEIEMLNRNIAELAPLIRTGEGQQFLQTITAASSRMNEFNERNVQLLSNNNIDGAIALYRDEFLPYANQLQAQSERFRELQVETMAQELIANRSIKEKTQWLTAGLLVVCILVGAVVVFIVLRINHDLRDTAASLSVGADQITSAASQVSSSSQSLAQGASEQAASLEETSASSEAINSMARRNTDNSKSTVELLSRSQRKVGQANQYLQEMVVSMSLITDSSGKISKIIKVIDEIAFQTNILALNAAVEAARAGEAGMGFAVVADEVRSLAQRSAQAAKDTAILIEDSIARSNEGKVKVDQVALAIQAVTEDSAKVKVMVDEVSLGSEEQSRGIDQIGRAISQMEQVTQTGAASAEESAAAAEELSAQSEGLKELVARLQAMVGGGEEERYSTRTSLHAASSLHSSRPRRLQPAKGIGTAHMARSFQHNANPRELNAPRRRAAETEEFPMEENFQSF